MSEVTAVCKEMSQEEYLKIFEDNTFLKEKLNEIGISQTKDGQAIVRLSYSDLLTTKEKECLKNRFPGLSDKFFIKYGVKPSSFLICYTDAICENCNKGLKESRKTIANK
ncbi:hypothetical protein [uncultured Dokdonia sp.]|uniref:hypothetical protein n=1 Tax=uncultured Dokdonia sp. TaxID=575653 RepID=UPI002608E5E6|nr:hypothetical protein [uncultured Dokdonia sp.]